MIRLLDILFSIAGLILGFPIFLLLFIIGFLDTGSPLFFQERIGCQQKTFKLIKFRTMKTGTASVATHMVDVSAITSFGHFLRHTKLDELPQLWNVFTGDMSFIGPRPCLPTQHELIRARASKNVFTARPGISGLAQINNIDMSTPEILAVNDATMLEALTLKKYFYYIVQTVLGKGRGDKIKT